MGYGSYVLDTTDLNSSTRKRPSLYNKGDIRYAIKIFGLAFEKNPENMTSISGMELCIKSLKNSMK